MNHQPHRFFALGLGLLFSISAALALRALAGGNHSAHDAHKTEATADMTDGEVRKVDIDGAKVTLKHADIKSLDMPAMTMVFVVKDKAMLSAVKAGDKVRFKAVNDGGKYTITELQVVR
jgi:Cu(I)/Ag(I) efflux system protein CusF